MKKYIKIAVAATIGLLSSTVFAAQTSESETSIIDSFCNMFPTVCTVSANGNGSGREIPDPPKDKKSVSK